MLLLQGVILLMVYGFFFASNAPEIRTVFLDECVRGAVINNNQKTR